MKKTCKRHLTGLILLCFALLLPSLYGMAGESITGVTSEGLRYRIDNGEATIIGYTGAPTAIAVPAAVQGAPVTSIGNRAFWNCSSLTSVVLPNGLTTIWDGAFNSCNSLASITIPGSVTKIWTAAFAYCSSLKSVTIPAGVTKLHELVFTGCSSLTSVTLQAGLIGMDYGVFKDCASLKSITIPASVTRMEEGIFENTPVTINGYLNTAAHTYAQENGIAFVALDVPAGLLYRIEGDHAIITGYTGTAKALVIPGKVEGVTVTGIGNEAFFRCSSLTSVTLPSSVTSIGDDAFFGCSSLTSFVIPAGVTSIQGGTFGYCTSLQNITIPTSVASIGIEAFRKCSSLTSITIPNGITRIKFKTFCDCFSLSSINIPASVTGIEQRAFESCTSLDSITVPASVTSIGEGVFAHCPVTIYGYQDSDIQVYARNNKIPFVVLDNPDGYIPNETKDGFLYSIRGNTVTITGYKGTATDITIPHEVEGMPVTQIQGYAFYSSGLTSAVIPAGVTSIGESAFYDCRSLRSVTIPGSVAYIGAYAFFECESLTSVNIPGSVAHIKAYVFAQCSSLQSITLPVGITSIGDFAFSGCVNLNSINIPESVASIGNYAFGGCDRLSSISIPKNVTSIGKNAFDTSITIRGYLNSAAHNFALEYGIPFEPLDAPVEPGTTDEGLSYMNDNLGAVITGYVGNNAAVVIPASINGATVHRIAEAAFQDSIVTSVTIPASVTSIGDSAFSYCDGLHFITIPTSVTTFGQEVFAHTVITIQGYLNSAAHEYAEKHAIPFKALDAPPAELPGDANGDNSLNILDLVAIIDYIVSETPAVSMKNADANGDGEVDILDLVWIIDRMIAA
jgi:hypothetical protein